MARDFSELWDRMPAEDRAQADRLTQAMLAEIRRKRRPAEPGQAVAQGFSPREGRGPARGQESRGR